MRFIPLLLLIFNLPLFAQDTTAPREKLYLHFDKSTYSLTDTIWFKGYLTDASTHTASPLSGLIYTELINSATGQVIQSLSLPTTLGLTWGSFALNPNKYNPGNYTIRAYTNWMQNFGETHFFKKEITIVSLLSEQGQPAKKSDTSLKQQLQNIDIQFLPEGGKFIIGITQRMAFKAININGKGIVVQGEIVDSKQNKVIDFETNALGMGYINILPAEGESYTALVRYGDLVKEVSLPKPQLNGILLQVTNHYSKDSIKITAYSSQLSEKEITLVGQTRGQTHFTSKIKFNTNIKFIYIPKNVFPTGVSQILLMDGNKTINERNFFINRKDELKLALSTTNMIYGIRDSIPIQLNVLDAAEEPVEASFSMAITDDTQVAKDSVNDANILTYLLLSSDLKGEIEKPGYYFHQSNEQKHNELDALMLTQGWISYDWDPNKKPFFKMEKEYTVNGRVHGVLKKPIPNAKMTMFGKNRGMMMLNTVANDKGEFTFNDLPVMDSAFFVIQAKNAKDKAGALTIEVNEFKRPKISILPKKAVFADFPLDSIVKNFIAAKKEEAKFVFGDGIVLNEVKIVGKRVIKNSKNLIGPGEADITITETELNKVAKKPLFELLQEKIPGFLPGRKSKYHSKDFWIDGRMLKFVIDGTPIDFFYSPPDPRPPHDYYNFIREYLDNYFAEDIAGIEQMNSYKYSFKYVAEYGGLPAENTYIEITTRGGFGAFLKGTPNIYRYKPMNYGDTKTFYHPRYTAINKNDKKPDFRSTLYWNPNLVTDEKGNAQTSFFSADKKGSYTVWVEGSDMQGNFGFKTMKLIIK